MQCSGSVGLGVACNWGLELEGLSLSSGGRGQSNELDSILHFPSTAAQSRTQPQRSRAVGRCLL